MWTWQSSANHQQDVSFVSQCGEPFPHSLIFLARTEPLHGWSGLGMLPCSLSGRAGVRLQGSPVPSLGLFSRRQTGSSRTPRALWLELVWIPGLQTLATAQSALDLSPPSKKKTYLMIPLFWVLTIWFILNNPVTCACCSLLAHSVCCLVLWHVPSAGPSGLPLPVWAPYFILEYGYFYSVNLSLYM